MQKSVDHRRTNVYNEAIHKKDAENQLKLMEHLWKSAIAPFRGFFTK